MNAKINVTLLDYHLTNSCNLHCESCSHFSNFHVHSNAVTPETAHDELLPWSKKLEPEFLSLIGGEPTLNPDLCEVIEAVSPLFNGKKRLTTNGFFLHRHSRLPEVLRTHGVSMWISLHHKGKQYQEKEREIRKLVYPWIMDGTDVVFQESDSQWLRFYRETPEGTRPLGGVQRKSWEICPCRESHPVYKRHLWKCPPLAYFQDLEEKLGRQGAEWELFRQYKPLPEDCTVEELKTFLQEDEPQCSLCPDKPHLFQIRDPTVRTRKAV